MEMIVRMKNWKKIFCKSFIDFIKANSVGGIPDL
jgi:hypothetical protein